MKHRWLMRFRVVRWWQKGIWDRQPDTEDGAVWKVTTRGRRLLGKPPTIYRVPFWTPVEGPTYYDIVRKMTDDPEVLRAVNEAECGD